MDRAVHRLFASLRALQRCKTEPAGLVARKIGCGTNFVCGVADPVSTCVHPTEHPNLWGVDGSRDVSVDTLRVEVGKVLHSTCCVFPVHPRLTYESYSCRRGLGVCCCVRDFLVSMVAGRI